MMQKSSVLQKILLLFAFVGAACVKGQRSDWSYENTQSWGNNYPQCNGNRQSPIRLRGTSSFILPILPIKFDNYDISLRGPLNFTNNGHSVEFAVPAATNGQRPYIMGGILSNRYEAQSLHFHWGSSNSRGSEHFIDNRQYDVEMHIVHKNVRYSTVAEAAQHQDGLAVLGVMFKIVNVTDRFYPGLTRVLDALPSVVNFRSSVNITGVITLGQMLGDINTKRYFTYSGSVTIPNCGEAITWIVFPQALAIAREQIEKFWSIRDENGNILINNFRPLQNRNRRPVFLAFSNGIYY